MLWTISNHSRIYDLSLIPLALFIRIAVINLIVLTYPERIQLSKFNSISLNEQWNLVWTVLSSKRYSICFIQQKLVFFNKFIKWNHKQHNYCFTQPVNEYVVDCAYFSIPCLSTGLRLILILNLTFLLKMADPSTWNTAQQLKDIKYVCLHLCHSLFYTINFSLFLRNTIFMKAALYRTKRAYF